MTTLEELQTGLQPASAEVVVSCGPSRTSTRSPQAASGLCVTPPCTSSATRAYTRHCSRISRSGSEQSMTPRSMNEAFFVAMDEDRPRALAEQRRDVVPRWHQRPQARRSLPIRWVRLDRRCHRRRPVRRALTPLLRHGPGCQAPMVLPRDRRRCSPACNWPRVRLLPRREKTDDLHALFAIEGDQSTRFCCQVRAGTMEFLDADADTDGSISGRRPRSCCGSADEPGGKTPDFPRQCGYVTSPLPWPTS